ncbi:hypothetical protein RAS1_05460 [Phycisphaerae bacterium RAS1]|nr:hypothetical protein RAS1_05460 [Phycisphaerae bacterium RAS1]
MFRRFLVCSAVGTGLLGTAANVLASGPNASPFALTYAQDKPAKPAEAKPADKAAKPADAKPAAKPADSSKTTAMSRSGSGGASWMKDGPYTYRGVDTLFSIREANPDIGQGEWQFNFIGGWQTASNGDDDNLLMSQSIAYGFTDDVFVQLEVIQPRLGDGGESGAGDMNLNVFWRAIQEQESLPAFMTYGTLRIPSGDGSSGVDGTLNGVLTKTFDKFRVHFQGFIRTANGDIGAERYDRDHFQWGVGPGFDYQVTEDFLVVLNYLNGNADRRGERNVNLIQTGAIWTIAKSESMRHVLKLVGDIGCNGTGDTPNLGARFMYSLALR